MFKFIFLILIFYVQLDFVFSNYQSKNSKNSVLRAPSNEWEKTVPRTTLKTELEFIQASLNNHNYYRSFHGAEPLELNLTLCEISQAWADQRANGRIGHNPDLGYIFGENIYAFGVVNQQLELNASVAVDAWYNEVKDYNFETCRPYNNEKIGHFTQLVWKKSREFGLAATLYKRSDEYGQMWDYVVIVANYYPTGNVLGAFQENVVPRKPSSWRMQSTSMATLLLTGLLISNELMIIIKNLISDC